MASQASGQKNEFESMNAVNHIEDYLFALQQKNIEVRAEGGKLRFKAPAGALTEVLRAELGARKGEILEFLQRKAIFEQPIPRLAAGALVQASFAQQRLLFLEQMETQKAVYNIPAVLRCQGILDAKLLEASLVALVERHESLRACFPSVEGQVLSRVREVYNPLHVTDLSGLEAQAQQERVKALITEHAQRSFDLDKGPLLDLHLLNLGNGQQILSFNTHHIISDGWSVGVMIREWKELYNALAAGQDAALPVMPIQFNDYAAWQRQWLEQGILASQLAYWKHQLNGLPELLALPTDFSRPPLMSFKGRHLHVTLNRALSQQVRQTSQDQGATVFMTLLAVFNLLLHRWSGQDDLAVGSPIANRTHPQTEGLIGFFVNTLVLRSRLDGTQNFSQWLQQVRQTSLAAYAHQDLPFDYLVEQLNPARSMGHSPLFQVMFALQNAHQEKLELGAARLELLKPDHNISKFDLSLSVGEEDGCLVCDWEYCTDLFQPETMARLSGYFEQLLQGVLADPTQPVARVPMLKPADVQQLTAWSRNPLDLPSGTTVVDLFEAQAARHPDHTAVVFTDQSLTYGELNTRANQLARHLMQLGAAPDTLVGLCIERSPEMVIGLLAILKSGSAYLPLDPEYPQDRLNFMLEDSGLNILLTHTHLRDRLPHKTTAAVCCIDSAELDPAQGQDIPRQSSPEHLAYVIYTSGSTGKPKGVMIEHAALANYAQSMARSYQMTPADRVLQFSSINFDASAEEIYTTLTAGACLVLRDKEMLATEQGFLDACKTLAITVLPMPTAYWHQLVSSQAHWPDTLRLVIIGGEAVSLQHVQQWQHKRLSAVQLVNSYGPTEATVAAAAYWIGAEAADSCPIGKPLPNTCIHLLDANLDPVAPGVAGELCIAGAGLARGYLNRPELTAEKFVEINLFGRRERIYRSGDLARWRADGNLDYLGRIDNQVKLRGFRIELGEIESALTRHAAIGESVVILREDEGDRFLAAYVTTQHADQAAAGHLPAELRLFLREGLPQWMIPTTFTVLDKLPLTPNGKVDRKALPAPDRQQPQGTTPLLKPHTVLEQKIAAVWQKVLKLEQVGIQDNFFDLGGHSLLLLQVLSQLRDVLGISLSVVTLFQYPTIQTLAVHLTRDLTRDQAASQPETAEVVPKPGDDSADHGDIAVIGMAGRFPGATDIDAFWENLRNGVESIRFFSDEELLESGVDPQLFNRPDYVRAAGILDRPEYFDAAFFGYPPKEAELLDPQQRLFMETAWTALEHAGYDVGKIPCSVGIFAGAGTSTYFLNNLWPNQALLAQFGQQQVFMGGEKDFIAARAAYKLDLRGPALSINTACSTSLVAVHLARQSLLQNECRMALAGGVTVFFPQKKGYVYQEGMIMSPDGHCRAFDADAKGSVGGAGVATVVLKRLRHALEDGDTVHAVIKNSAVNNDGIGRIGFTAPSVEGQSRVVRDAMRGLDYESIGHIETHGTGTLLGDPIEISALNQAYKAHTRKAGYCALGSVKTNIGHLDTAAGVTGLIKTVMALKHREIPPTLHFKAPNPQIDFAGSPFFVNTERKAWASATPRRAGVSSFGIGGTNAHVVLEEAPAQASSDSRPWQLICLSAKTETALRQYRSDLAEYLGTHPDLNLADVAYTFNAGRGAFAHRGTIVGRDVQEIATQLGQEKSKHWQRSRVDAQPSQVVFMFPGQGSQHANMALGLYRHEATFRAVVDACAERLLPHLQLDIRALIYPTQASPADLKASQAAQPALFVIEYALAKLCMSWGIQPAAMIGHSIGEYVAACLAGVFSLEDALQLVAARGGLMQSVPQGEMLGILLSRPEVEALLPEDVFIAAHNAPSLTSVSGSAEAIGRFSAQLQGQRILFSRLQTLNAAHSPVMQPVLEPFRAHLRKIKLNPPQRPFISNLTGTWITAEQATSVEYWCQHLLQPVQFATGIQTLVEQDAGLLLEVGPDMVLTSFAQQFRPQYKLTALNLLRTAASTQEDMAWVLGVLGQLWLKHVPLDWAAFYADERRLRIPVPTYPFERQRYWIEPVPRFAAPQTAPAVAGNMPTCVADAGQGQGSVHQRPDLGVEYVEPATAAQKTLAGIWQQLLGIVPIGLHDDFFRLGGNSLLGAQVLSRLREAFAVEIPLNILFQCPVLEDLAQWLDRQQGEVHATLPPILVQAADAPLVMSFSQQRLRFFAQLEGDSAAYNLPGVVHLAGSLDEAALRAAFATLIQRHDSLRLSFPAVEGALTVRKGGVYDPLVIDDLREVSRAAQEPLVSAWMTRHAQAPFHLDTGPLLRLNLLRLADEEQILLINMHHIISDGWTIGLLIHEWCQLYNACVRQQPHTLPTLPIQYTDYAAWQRQWLQGAVLERQIAYWKHKLAGAPELLELPTDFARPAVTTYRGGHQRLTIDQALAQQVQQFSQAHGVTLFMTLLAAFNVLLHRYSGQQDLLVGTPVANRTQRDTENLVGFFVNTLVLRTVVGEGDDFLALLQQVKQTELEAHDHQDIPFDVVVEQLNPARSLSHAPLFQVMFALQNAPEHALALDGLHTTLLQSDVRTSKFDLTLSIEQRAQGLACDWEYSTDLFRPDTIARMHEHWQVLLRGILRDPRQPVSRLPLLTDADVRRLTAWNRTEAEYPQHLTVVDLFEQQVDRTPDATAVVFEGTSLDYAELDRRANRVAHALIDQGIRPGMLVGLCVARSLEMVVGLLGMLKAGGAYVPLDPDYPPERLRFMVEDSAAPILLTHAAVQARLPRSEATMLRLDDAAGWADWPDTRPAHRAAPTDLAYVIYTSGSTGRPKGVLLQHGGAVNLACAQIQALATGPGCRVLQFAALGFDAAAWEVLMALGSGGALHLAPSQQLREDLLTVLQQQAITHVTLPPSMLAVLPPQDLPALRTLVVAGEACPPALLAQWAPGRLFCNAYGPTETTVCATIGVCTPQMDSAPIGVPLANTRVYLVDGAFNVVPPGVPGELCIAGDGLARGYLHRPELTAEKFITAEVLGRVERLYRTGDLARWNPDGHLEYLGRMDDQVKLRGFRIELGEIESALGTHEAVSAATVVLREREGLKALAGYVVLRTAVAPDTLKVWLQARLPEYMVPATLTFLDALPLTPNGKVDRRALPEPVVVASAGRALRGPTEELLGALWAEMLGLGDQALSAESHFFALGGHSLLATRVATRVRQQLGVDCPLRALFEHPVLAGLATWLDAQQRGHAVEVIEPLPAGASPVLSPAQQRLWFLAQLEGASSTYNIPAALRLMGDLNEAALRQSLKDLTQRQAGLRQSFPAVQGQAMLHECQPWDPIELTDLQHLQGLPEDAQAGEVQRRVHAHAQAPFDLSAGPLFKASLLRLGTREHVLLLNLHHSIGDGWSVSVLVREWAELYRAACNARAADLAPLPIAYRDVAAWQQRWLQGPAAEQQTAWWVEQLQGAPALLELPTDRPRPAQQSYRGAGLNQPLTRALGEQVQTLARRQGATVFMTLLAALQVVLHRYSGQDDLCVGTPVANRGHGHTEGLVGLFVNTLVLRARFQPAQPFSALLAQTRQTALGAFARQELPFERVVEALSPQRSLAHAPLFQVLFVLQNNDPADVSLEGLRIESVEQEVCTAKFDLTLSMVERDGVFLCDWEYATDLFEAATIARLASHFEQVLHEVCCAPDTPVQHIALLTEADRAQSLSWNQTDAAHAQDRTVVDLVEAQVDRTPDATAVVHEGRTLCYAELDARANQVAHALIERGVGPDTLVGLCVPRSLEMAIGLLGILKAGAAYVPLDPDYPAERLRFMLEDAQAPVVLTHAAVQDRLPASAAERLRLDEPQHWAHRTAHRPARRAGPTDLGYVLFTSGSTGQPKGVMLPHRALCNLMQWHALQPGLASACRTLQFTSLSFDVSFQEIFSTWSAGGSLVLVSDTLRRDPHALLDYLRAHRVERLYLPFVALNALAEAAVQAHANGPAQPPLALRSLVTAGEQLQMTPALRRWLQDSGIALHNHYGPTESHVVTSHTLAGPSTAWPMLPPIGRPIHNTRIHLLDPQLQPVPPGVPGELCIAGAGLARGYLNRPALTAEKFIEVEVLGRPERLYRTGDLAKWNAQGELDYLGRIDQQVKLRGFRIELGEIESALGTHPAVSAAAVVVHAQEDLKALAGYVVLHDPAEVAELKDWLKARLPEYMVPASLTILQALPMTPNGKVNRKALPAPDLSDTASTGQAQAPATPTEQLLCALWSQTLKRRIADTQSHFFDVGGHSLLATQLVSRIRESFGIAITLQTVFERPVLAQQARWLAQQQRGDAPVAVIPAQADGAPLVMSHAQQRLWFLTQLEGQAATYNMSAALRLTGELNVQALRHALRRLVERHASLRQYFPVSDGEALVALLDAYDPLQHTELPRLSTEAQQAQVQRLADADAVTPFVLETGPLLRVQLLTLDAASHVLLVNMHHIISDGWSMGVLLRELNHFYGAHVQGLADKLPDLAIQYGDYATWQREWLQGARLEAQHRYWVQQLSGLPTLLELPTDRPRPAMRDYRGAHLGTRLDVELTAHLNGLARTHGCTLFMLLLAAFQTLLHRHTQQSDLCVGSPIANRTHAQTEDLIGFFVNTLVLRARFQPDMTFEALLHQVRQAALGAYAHQDIPFEQIVEQLNPERSLSHSPLFQVMFVLQNNEAVSLDLPGLQVEPLSADYPISKFDLTLSMQETADGLTCHWEYASALFDEDTMARLANHFGVLLHAIVDRPDAPLQSLSLLTPAEQQQQQQWNDTATDWPLDQTIVTLFEAQVRQTPGHTAVVFDGQSLTYAELNTRANRLAHALIGHGVHADTLVGVCAERSLDMVVGLLAILKAGGAYVPFDITYPAERLSFLFQDSRVPMLLTQRHLAQALPLEGLEQRPLVLCLDDPALCAAQPEADPVARSGPDDLAYVIYTSGSTGQPKGVCVAHASVVRLVRSTDYMRFDADQVFLQYAPIAFDAATLEIWGPLLHGARLVVATPDTQGLDLLAATLVQHGITALWLTSSLFNLMIEQHPGSLRGVRQLLIGGEALSVPHVEKAMPLLPDTAIINGYGPTENTTFTCCHPITPRPQSSSIPIGRPIANTRVFVVDKAMQPLPVGCIGELVTGGAGLARGYLNRPDLTAEKFVTVALFGRTERVYRTGDLARWLPDGTLDYLGRIDHQVKLRGFRIELGEIEAVLCRHASVSSAAVVMHERDGNKSLTAYLTGNGIDTSALRAWLEAQLPDYMVPTAIGVLEHMPLTPNGKIDRKALPVLDMQRQQHAHGAYCAPRDTLELRLSQLWEELLDVHPVGVKDDFFALGGHSLLAMRLIAQIEQSFMRRIPLAKMLHHATIAAIADLLRQQDAESPWSCVVPVQPGGASRPVFLVHPGGGNVLCYLELAQQLGPDQPVHAFQAYGLEAGHPPYSEVEHMARAYIAAMKTVQPEGPYQLAGWSFGGLVAMEMATQLQAQGESVGFLGLLDAIAPQVIRGFLQEPADDAQFFADYFADSDAEISIEHLRRLGPDEQMAHVVEQGRQFGIFPADVSEAQIRRMVRVYRTNVSASLRYHAQPYQGVVTLFQATDRRPEDPIVPAEHGWQACATQPVEVIKVPGKHHTMVNSPHVQVLAQKMKACLAAQRPLQWTPAMDGETALA